NLRGVLGSSGTTGASGEETLGARNGAKVGHATDAATMEVMTDGPTAATADGGNTRMAATWREEWRRADALDNDDGGRAHEGRPVSIIDWKSTTAKRICRSTFAAETIACTDGVEVGQYVRSFTRCMLDGYLRSVERLGGTSLRFITDCKSLFDHLHREGIPRVPTDRRLAIDLAALRQALKDERRDGVIPLTWLPTSYQLADILTKPLNPTDFWSKTESP
ncbi:GIP, partial [Symbiodinium microadriaticum]